jgi:dienelactone hydrolase
MASLTGRTLGHYRILELLGAGGMGAVYRAEDTSLGREVALKVLPDDVAQDPERLSRFRREARAVAALNHPNIVTVHSVEEAESIHFLTLELVQGETLDRRIPQGGMGLADFFAVAEPLADALAAAHARGIVHRDVKTANVMVTAEGRTKVLDFGLAKFEGAGADVDATQPTQTATRLGAILGTPAYMSPEQARGLPADARSDIFSTGVVLYEMLTGERPFRRADGPSTIHAILHETLPDVSGVRKQVPRDLAAVVARCLEKDPAKRFENAQTLREALAATRARHLGSRPGVSAIPRWSVIVLALAVVAAGVAAALWWAGGGSATRKVRNETMPAIEHLLDEGKTYDAYVLAREALETLPDDPLLARLFERASLPATVTTDPPGATVELRPYSVPDAPWHRLGVTPIENARVPTDYLVYRVSRDGYETVTLAQGRLETKVELVPAGTAPAGMVRIPAGSVVLGPTSVELPAFWLDRNEVTNRDYARFVEAGGYADRQHWEQTFVENARTLGFEEAIARFVDTTGRAGPAGWELGRYPEGTDEQPVRGVSWYEAAAYAHWAGRSLPTVYHWNRGAGAENFAEILVQSNFESDGPAPVGAHAGLGPFGNYDMAGNVKEWCWNATGDKRYTLGGGWNESAYLFTDLDAQPPMDRGPSQGVRLALYDEPPQAALLEPFGQVRYDFAQVKPVDDATFAFFSGLYAYERADLDARVEAVDDSSTHWRRETISIEPAYSGSRLLVHVFLPKNGAPPYQTVVFRPSSVVNHLTRIEDYMAALPDWIPRSGRALVVPALWGTLGRQPERPAASPQQYRDRVIRQVQDYRRAIDYLETRDDVDLERLAYVGLSAGGEYGAVYLALDPRVRAAVLIAAGFHDAHMLEELPEVNPWNFAPRVRLPTLMINGENDFTLPVETAQKPLYDLLGTPAEDKRSVLIAGGHVTTDRHALIRESLAWLDRYLGPVASGGDGS